MPASPGEPLRLFSVPVHTGLLDGLVERAPEILQAVNGLRSAGPGIQASNRHAWHSERDLHRKGAEDDPLGWVGHRILEHCRATLTPTGSPPPRLTLEALWAMVLEEGGWSAPHHHFPFPWSGVVYVDAERSSPGAPGDQAGKLELCNPIALPERFGQSNGVVITPRNGLLILFPGALSHFVHPVRGAGTRVSLSFNLGLAGG